MAPHPESLSVLVSGGFDGEIIVWDIPQRKKIRSFLAHEGMIRGVTFNPSGENFISIGDDKTIKIWKSTTEDEDETPINTMLSKYIVTGISHHRKNPLFVTCGEVCQLWDESRNEPVRSFQWGVDSLHDVAFNLIQANIMAACASDRSVILYDCRDVGPVRKIVMKLRSNKICWNPMQAYNFTVANEDYNLYTFDTRNLQAPINVHMDHIAAVTDIDYAPTGKEFVSGSYDKSVRIYEIHKGHSREIYHTKRMQRLTCVKWSLDNKYIFSGSDEMNIRIWKARAAEKLGVVRMFELKFFTFLIIKFYFVAKT